MEVYLIRHTTPDAPKGLIYGHLDVPLSQNFDSEAQEVILQLPQNIDVLYTSPSKRCKLLSEKIKAKQIILDDQLKELNFGAWEGKYWTDISENELNPWMEDYINQTPPKGESLLGMQKRVLDFWEAFLQKKLLGNVVIITHAGVIRILRSHLEQVPLEEIFDLKVDYGAIFKYKIDHP